LKKILLLTDRLKYSCGITTYLYYLINNSDHKLVEFHLYAAPGNRVADFRKITKYIQISERFAYENKNIFTFISNVVMVLDYCRKNKIDIIHSQNYYVANIANVVKKILRLKTIQTKHNVYPKGKLPQFIADKIIVVNKDIVEIAVSEFKVNPKILYSIPNGLSFPRENIYPKSTDVIKVIVVSRLIYEKGIDIFIKAVGLSKNMFKRKCEFIIAGDGNYRKELEKLNNQLNTNIKFVGTINNVHNLLKSSHIFVMPTRWAMEGFPYAIIEAVQAQNLVITSNFRGLNSYFKHKKDGFVFEINDVQGLSLYLIKAINNYESHKEKICRSYKKFYKIFNINKMLKRTISVYNEL